MYKILTYVLAGLLACLGGLYLYKSWQNDKKVATLSSALAKSEGMIKETKTSYSAKAQQVEDLESANKELQGKIKDRDEKVAALGEVALTWKDKYFKIKNASQTVVDSGGQPIPDAPSCDLPPDARVRVDFDQTQDYLKVTGHTLTNPAYAEVEVSWTRALKLSFILTKKDKDFRLYLDSNSEDLVPGDLSLRVDPSVFERPWYEHILVGTDLSLYGDIIAGSFKVMYDFDRYQFGPHVLFSDKGTSFGLSAALYLFR